VPTAKPDPHHPFRSPEARERYLTRYDEREKAWPIPSETRTVTSERAETYVRLSGPPDAPAVVMLPGKWSDSLMWPEDMIAALSQRYRVCAPDNPYDFGRSVRDGGKGDAADYVAWMDGLLDALSLTDVRFVGLSLGAWVASEYALRAPERVAKMVWISPGGIVAPPASLRTLPGIPMFFALTVSPSEKSVRRCMRWLMPLAADAGGSVQREFDEYVSEIAIALESLAPLPAPLETDRRFTDEEMSRLRMPLLYIAGEFDKFVPASKAVTRLAATVPHAETLVFEGTGHELVMTEPEAITRRVLAFLDA
jgi:pimeloyl-ACP methyl ester carboxylesterase